jgi:hypothetical protein
MPIVGDAAKVHAAMADEYGKKKGERIFYATANKQKRKPENWKKRADAFELGMHAAFKAAGIRDVGEVQGLFKVAKELLEDREVATKSQDAFALGIDKVAAEAGLEDPAALEAFRTLVAQHCGDKLAGIGTAVGAGVGAFRHKDPGESRPGAIVRSAGTGLATDVGDYAGIAAGTPAGAILGMLAAMVTRGKAGKKTFAGGVHRGGVYRHGGPKSWEPRRKGIPRSTAGDREREFDRTLKFTAGGSAAGAGVGGAAGSTLGFNLAKRTPGKKEKPKAEKKATAGAPDILSAIRARLGTPGGAAAAGGLAGLGAGAGAMAAAQPSQPESILDQIGGGAKKTTSAAIHALKAKLHRLGLVS